MALTRDLTGIILTAALALGTASSASGSAVPGPGAATGGAVVRVEQGLVAGRAAPAHVTFAGVPYAAPPVGALRWAPPGPPPAWAGVRDATTPAGPCAQPGYDPDGTRTVIGGEDCLHLNVTAPAGDHRRGRRPVLVWFHGGGFTTGAGHDYDGTRLVEQGGLVVVTVNYRLGPLGFLASPALDGESGPSGNHGIQDQQAALRWIRGNAARFGGDPGNVTIAGQSAGARSVCAHLAAPGSRGLFSRAIVQSGACANPLLDRNAAHERGARVAAALGCTPEAGDVAACLRGRPVADLLDASPPPAPVTGESRDAPWLPVTGTAVLPRQPLDAIAGGSARGIPLLIGSTRDEMRPFVGFRYDAAGRPLGADAYRSLTGDAFGADAEEVLARYPVEGHASPALALATVLSDWGGSIGACPMLRTAQVAARHAPVFAYELTEDSGQVYGGFPLGAYHGWDLPFLWDVSIPGSTYPALTPAQRALADRMVAHWSSFAATGRPDRRGMPPWPRLRPGDDAPVMPLTAAGTATTPEDFAARHQCGFWNGIRAMGGR